MVCRVFRSYAQILILKDVMMTFHKMIYLVADFVQVRTYRVVIIK